MPHGGFRSTRRGRAALLVALVTVAGAASVSLAREPAPARADLSAVDHVVTAARVAAWSRRSHDAPGMILAARMMIEATPRAARIEGVNEGGEDAGPTATTPGPELTPAALLDEAEAFARGDPRTLEEIAEARAAATRGVLNSPFGLGPIVTSKDVQPQQTFWFRVSARGGEVLRVAAIGDGDTDIDLTIRDPDGRQICRDGQFDHYPVCTVTPDADGQLRIDIVNRGRVWTKVQIVSN